MCGGNGYGGPSLNELPTLPIQFKSSNQYRCFIEIIQFPQQNFTSNILNITDFNYHKNLHFLFILRLIKFASGNWMIFLIVYSLIVTILLIVIVVTVVYCFLKYDWETEGGISTIGSTGRSYYVSHHLHVRKAVKVYAGKIADQKI